MWARDADTRRLNRFSQSKNEPMWRHVDKSQCIPNIFSLRKFDLKISLNNCDVWPWPYMCITGSRITYSHSIVMIVIFLYIQSHHNHNGVLTPDASKHFKLLFIKIYISWWLSFLSLSAFKCFFPALVFISVKTV